jgi:hypothetical protein
MGQIENSGTPAKNPLLLQSTAAARQKSTPEGPRASCGDGGWFMDVALGASTYKGTLALPVDLNSVGDHITRSRYVGTSRGHITWANYMGAAPLF